MTTGYSNLPGANNTPFLPAKGGLGNLLQADPTNGMEAPPINREPQVPPGVIPQQPPQGAPYAAPVNYQPYQPMTANWLANLLSQNITPPMMGGFNRFDPFNQYMPPMPPQGQVPISPFHGGGFPRKY